MGFYTIACTWEMYGKTVVEADNLDDAIRIVESDDFPLPNDAVYLIGTFAVDRDTLE